MSEAVPRSKVEPGSGGEGHTPLGPDGLELEPTDRRLVELSRAELLADLEETEIPEAGAVGGLAAGAPASRSGLLRPTVVIGDDDRVPVADPTAFPWQAICFLAITAADGSPLRATGWLAGPRLVVTAGHCVYRHERGGWARSVEVVPGRNGGDHRFGTFAVPRADLRSVIGWTERHDHDFDYGALLLPRSLAGEVGFFGFEVASDDALRSQPWNLGGYPDDREPGTLWWHARRIEIVSTNTLLYNIDTFGGQSGAPLWRNDAGGPLVAGVHSGERSGANQAVRISPSVHANLRSWKQL